MVSMLNTTYRFHLSVIHPLPHHCATPKSHYFVEIAERKPASIWVLLIFVPDFQSQTEEVMMPPKGSSPSVSKTIKGSASGTSISGPLESRKLRSTTTKSLVDRKPTSKNVSSPEKRIVRVSDLQTNLTQFKENLKKAKSEKSQLLKQTQELKQTLSDSNARLSLLSLEEQRAKVSEHNMLESMVSQTKQLEEAKIDLEESKLEIQSLREAIQLLEKSPSKKSLASYQNNIKNIGKNNTAKKDMMSASESAESSSMELKCAEEEIAKLRCQLKFANEAEENGKMALDDLVVALREVTIEANEAKERLSKVELEVTSLKTQIESTKSILRITQEKLQCALDDSDKIKLEYEDFSLVKEDNCALVESKKVLMEEISKLKETVNYLKTEGKHLEKSLEIARIENCQLKDNVTKLETSLLSTSRNVDLEKSKLIIGETANPSIATDNTKSSSGPGFLKDSSFTMVGCSSGHQENDHNDRLSWNCDEFDHIDATQIREMQNEEQDSPSSSSVVKKSTKNPMFQKLGGMLKGKRFHK